MQKGYVQAPLELTTARSSQELTTEASDAVLLGFAPAEPPAALPKATEPKAEALKPLWQHRRGGRHRFGFRGPREGERFFVWA